MKYYISYTNPLEHLIDIRLVVQVEDLSQLIAILPIWRPGRYEAANYAKNVQKIDAIKSDSCPARIVKPSPGKWKIDCEGASEVEIRYKYYAHKMDAGNSFLDDKMLYINFINCMLYVEQFMNQHHEVILDLPEDYLLACSLKKRGMALEASSYYELVDSPLIASAMLEHHNYEIGDTKFHLWIQGNHSLDVKKLTDDFISFSKAQIMTMGDFPVSEYHFLIHFLPYKHYHGVEHGASTVICMGPGQQLLRKAVYHQLLGVSSHELFHAWNVIKIRPKEMLPYDFAQPPVFSTGFVAEGFTTYYGDLFLRRSGVFTLRDYLNELEKLLTRHLLNYGRLHNSVVDSSIDLWFDGYQRSAPHKKSSIYIEGAVLALLIDLKIRKATDHVKSLDHVVQHLWENFGRQERGYDSEDILNVCEEVMGGSLDRFFRTYVHGTGDTKPILIESLADFGLSLSFEDRKNPLERHLGLILQETSKGQEVVAIEPGSSGSSLFSVKDVITTVNTFPVKQWLRKKKHGMQLTIGCKRQYESIDVEVVLHKTQSFFKVPKLTIIAQATGEQLRARNRWLGDGSKVSLTHHVSRAQ